ncbi:hypothetical protein [Saliphagus infecundisoli]|uniref:Glucose dehydrogenase C-terminal domain-containing protein n=1 Tax=Saliphagus infecundisoli TaxID=1849069 RepID=A0ABD5QB39_9EURY|nr:hypothetical protein [Saliphagus infecundisoli]
MALHREIVVGKKVLVGSVNSSVPHFEAAIDTMADVPEWFVDTLMTGVHDLAHAERVLETGDKDITTVVNLSLGVTTRSRD